MGSSPAVYRCQIAVARRAAVNPPTSHSECPAGRGLNLLALVKQRIASKVESGVTHLFLHSFPASWATHRAAPALTTSARHRVERVAGRGARLVAEHPGSPPRPPNDGCGCDQPQRRRRADGFPLDSPPSGTGLSDTAQSERRHVAEPGPAGAEGDRRGISRDRPQLDPGERH